MVRAACLLAKSLLYDGDGRAAAYLERVGDSEDILEDDKLLTH